MMKLERPPAPAWLLENYLEWGRAYQAKRQNPAQSNRFDWVSYQGQKVNLKLLPYLLEMTLRHCSFCDIFEMQSEIRATIEHFKPKACAPLYAYLWENLFLCCDKCQEKNAEYDPFLLKPDMPDYDFDRYFVCSPMTGRIEPNPLNDDAFARRRAELTICIYRLNDFGRPKARMRQLRKFMNNSDPEMTLDDFSYRFMLSAVA